jgi:hypothetical protein
VLLCAPRAAHAQSNEAIAEQLFLEGQRLLQEGKTHEACERLAMSERLDPAIGALLNLALCHEREGKTATAWSEYRDAAVQAANAGQPERERFAREHATALEREIAKVRIALAAAPEGTEIKLDGALLPAGLLNTDMPIDPGEHALEITAPGKKPWRASLRIARGAPLTRIDAALEDAPRLDAAAAPLPEAPSAPVAITSPSRPEAPASPPASRRTAGLVVAGIGVAGIGVGIALLVRSALFDDKSAEEAAKARQSTPPDARFKAASLSDHDAAVTNQTAGLIAGGVGLAAAGAGLYFLLTRDTSKTALVVPAVGPTHAGVDAVFRF